MLLGQMVNQGGDEANIVNLLPMGTRKISLSPIVPLLLNAVRVDDNESFFIGQSIEAPESESDHALTCATATMKSD
jgi:hypothetical protein